MPASVQAQPGLGVLRPVSGGKFEARKRLYHIALRSLTGPEAIGKVAKQAMIRAV